jgi:membrane fusion protein (multidrug efflux system)
MKPRRLYLFVFAILCAPVGFVAWRSLRAASEAANTATPSVQVATQKPVKGYLMDSVSAYGTAVPGAGGSLTVNVQVEGRIEHLFVTPGEPVRAGDRLLEFQISAAARSALAQAVSALKLADSEQQRISRLFAQQLATRDQLLVAEKALADARAALNALNADHGGASHWAILAPFDGVVGTVPVAQGDRVASAAPLVTLTRADGLVIRVGVEPAQRTRLVIGQKAALKSIGGSGAELQGTLVRIDRVLNPTTRLVDADVAVAAAPIMQGEAYMAQIAIGRIEGWQVPSNAVLRDAEGSYVFQTHADKAVRVPVRVLASKGTSSVISGPIKPDLPLVITGNYQLSDGMAVRTTGARE